MVTSACRETRLVCGGRAMSSKLLALLGSSRVVKNGGAVVDKRLDELTPSSSLFPARFRKSRRTRCSGDREMREITTDSWLPGGSTRRRERLRWRMPVEFEGASVRGQTCLRQYPKITKHFRSDCTKGGGPLSYQDETVVAALFPTDGGTAGGLLGVRLYWIGGR